MRSSARRDCSVGRLGLACAVLIGLLIPAQGDAQTFRGRVLDDANDAPIPTTLVQVLDASGETLAVTSADSAGNYHISPPGPGVYRIEAQRIGYEAFQTPLLETLDPEGVYPLDLLLHRAPIPIRGLTVSTERVARQLQLMTGMHPASLTKAPFSYEEIQRNIEMGRSDLASILRWSNTSSLLVFRTEDGPCFSLRQSGCLPVYFNGFRYSQELLDVIPMDMIYTMVLMYPKESIAYPAGAVLLYSEAWIR